MIIFPTPLTWLWVRHQVQICAWDSLIHHKDNWHWEIWGSRCCPLAAVCWGNLSAVWKESAKFKILQSFNMYSLSTCKNYGLFKKKHRALLFYYSCKCFLQCNSGTLYLMSTELKKSGLTCTCVLIMDFTSFWSTHLKQRARTNRCKIFLFVYCNLNSCVLFRPFVRWLTNYMYIIYKVSR